MMLRNIAVASALVGAAAQSSDVEQKFQEFEQAFGKNYASDDDRNFAKTKFAQNLETISTLQAAEQGTAVYSHLTPFADENAVEFSKRLGFRSTWTAEGPEGTPITLDANDAPTAYDWRTKGAVTPVKNQGQCGSCWAFATVGNIEGAGFVTTGKLISLSEQELVECDRDAGGDEGCNGGLPSNAYKHMISNKLGLETESDYPYTGRDGKTCGASAAKEKVFVGGWSPIAKDEDQVAAALVKYGPLAIGIDALPMQLYMGGIMDLGIFCPPTLDHGVTIVGYDGTGSKPYWVIKNSWGASWGEKGYLRIVKGKSACGLNQEVTTATQITMNSVETKPRYAKGYKRSSANLDIPVANLTSEDIASAPDSIDWSAKGATSSVNDQGQCGSCWAFSTMEGVESAVFMSTGKLPPKLSVQELVACEKQDDGCDGGDIPEAVSYLKKQGMASQSNYPDTSSKSGRNGRCKSFQPAVKVTGMQYAIPPCNSGDCSKQNEEALAAALAKYGPISICINSGDGQSGDWMNYNSGVLKGSCKAKASLIDHCVQLVGYDKTAAQPYWKIRNSWAKSYGEEGFIRIPYGNKNECCVGCEAVIISATNEESSVVV